MLDEIGIGGFVMEQDGRFLKLGTDAVLLSEFARIPKNYRVCDLGCGSGAVSLLVAARNERAQIEGVEIFPEVAALAEKNAAHNNISGRLKIKCMDIKDVPEVYTAGSFDAVVSNPPFLAKNGGLHTEGEELLAARMEIFCDIFDVCRAAGHLLRFGGVFSVVYRPARLADLFSALKQADLAPKRVRLVQDTVSAEPSLVLVEARKGGKSGIAFMPTLILKNPDGTESEETRRIYRR